MLQNKPKHVVEVTNPGEYADAIEAADTLGLELREVKVRGYWKGRDGPEPSRGSTWSVYKETKNARKWFYLGGNGHGKFAARPARSEYSDDGSLELRFD